ncbi:hypothetical protein AX16_010571 [Volvariella volvacea WC 439]|nr:hypothetical protein AX16_010571 [Volvariella volvacea WC 439]
MDQGSGLNSATTSRTETAKPFLEKPQAPFTSRRLSSRTNSETHLRSESSDVSLSVNYLPSKFSSNLLQHTGARQRKIPKRGGGVDAFKGGEGRIPGQDDEDDDDGLFGSKEKTNGNAAASARKLKWNRFKWTLFGANIILGLTYLNTRTSCELGIALSLLSPPLLRQWASSLP